SVRRQVEVRLLARADRTGTRQVPRSDRHEDARRLHRRPAPRSERRDGRAATGESVALYCRTVFRIGGEERGMGGWRGDKGTKIRFKGDQRQGGSPRK